MKGADSQVRVGNSLIPVGGDIIVEMDGKKINTTDDLIRMIRERRPGDKVEFNILRKTKFLRLTVTLGEKPVQR
jgi:S1-C subfamily serine protease